LSVCVGSSLCSSRTGLAIISWLIISRSSRRFSARTLTICTRPGVRICFCDTRRLSLSPCQAMDRPAFSYSNPSYPILVQAEMIAQINAPDFRIIAQFVRAALPKYLPIFQDVRVIRHAESFPDVMIGNEHANSRLSEIPDEFLQILHRERVNSRKRFVEQ